MIDKAAAMAAARGWDYDILSPLHLALVVPYSPLQVFHPMRIFCSMEGTDWGLIIDHEFLVEADRSEIIHDALLRLKQFCAPAELDLLPKPVRSIRYARDFEIENDVPGHLGLAIDEAVLRFNFVLDVLRLVNWGGKSAQEAITSVSVSERHQGWLQQAIKTQSVRNTHGADAG